MPSKWRDIKRASNVMIPTDLALLRNFEEGLCDAADDIFEVEREDLKRLIRTIRDQQAEIERLRYGLSIIGRQANKCHCDKGYPGGCGCGRAIGDTVEEIMEPKS